MLKDISNCSQAEIEDPEEGAKDEDSSNMSALTGGTGGVAETWHVWGASTEKLRAGPPREILDLLAWRSQKLIPTITILLLSLSYQVKGQETNLVQVPRNATLGKMPMHQSGL